MQPKVHRSQWRERVDILAGQGAKGRAFVKREKRSVGERQKNAID